MVCVVLLWGGTSGAKWLVGVKVSLIGKLSFFFRSLSRMDDLRVGSPEHGKRRQAVEVGIGIGEGCTFSFLKRCIWYIRRLIDLEYYTVLCTYLHTYYLSSAIV